MFLLVSLYLPPFLWQLKLWRFKYNIRFPDQNVRFDCRMRYDTYPFFGAVVPMQVIKSSPPSSYPEIRQNPGQLNVARACIAARRRDVGMQLAVVSARQTRRERRPHDLGT
jgi:hypothetical protein